VAGENGKIAYYVSFVEEAVLNPKYSGYVAGRVEVFDGISQWAIKEHRYFTKDWKAIQDLRDEWDLRKITKEQLDALVEILEKYNEP